MTSRTAKINGISFGRPLTLSERISLALIFRTCRHDLPSEITSAIGQAAIARTPDRGLQTVFRLALENDVSSIVVRHEYDADSPLASSRNGPVSAKPLIEALLVIVRAIVGDCPIAGAFYAQGSKIGELVRFVPDDSGDVTVETLPHPAVSILMGNPTSGVLSHVTYHDKDEGETE